MTFCPQCSTKVVVDPPVKLFEDFFHPQIIKVVQPVEIVHRHHCVPVPFHTFAFTVKDESCHTSGLETHKKSKKRSVKR